MTISVTTDFRDQYELERAVWLRRRFQWYASIVIAFVAGAFLLQLAVLIIDVERTRADIAAVSVQELARLIAITLYGAAFWRVYRSPQTRDDLLRLVTWLIIIYAGLSFASFILASELTRFLDPERLGDTGITGYSVGLRGLLGIFVSHFFACLFLPWTPRESLRPIYPLLAINALITIIYGWNESIWGIVLAILFSPLVALPGALLCWMRQGQFRKRFQFRMLRGHYGEMRREMVDARRIHEALFPPPIEEGPVRFTYEYEPMRQIGGDYLFARLQQINGAASPRLNVLLVDVTGHGIGAALTVNRLHGEIEREFGERPEASPGELLCGLNAYLHHTLASHSVYATVLAIQVDLAEHIVRWASAGHPPAFVCAANGRIERLDSTTFVLGACHGADFVPNEQAARFMPGDVLLAYTDGAIEARNQQGKMLRVDGLQRILLSGPTGKAGCWAGAIMDEIRQFRYGPTQDDTLILEIARPVEERP